jgi:hypothetical protein
MNFEKIAKASEALITTDLPKSEVDRFAELALKARSLPVRTVSFVPPMISTGNPDIEKIHATVKTAIDRSEGKKSTKKPTKASKTAPAPSTGTTGGSIGNLKEGYAANQATDLSSAC